MPSDPQQAYDNLIERVKRIWMLSTCASVLHWDMETGMPDGGSEHRGAQLALLSGMIHEQFTDEAIGDLLSEVEESDVVADPLSDAAVNVRELRREYDRDVRVPADLVEEIARETTAAHVVWRDARKDKDYSAFAPTLERIVELMRRKADAIGTGATRYETLLDGYEPGMTVDAMGAVFAELVESLAPLISAIADSGKSPDRSILSREYAVDKQEILGQIVAENIGFDLDCGRIAVSTHPFTCGLGTGDTRFTTRYDVHEPGQSLYAVMHEAGHGIYDQGLDPDHHGTPRGESVSLGIHESQSRMWENLVGRSHAFCEYVLPIARGIFPQALGGVSVDEFYWAVNDVQPSFIRVEADEATYNLHVLLRFEIEQSLISGDLAVADVPDAWNEGFEQLLGIVPPDDAAGCLQDVHWCGGGFGYFPTYTLGNLYGAQFFEKAREDVGDLDELVRRGDFGPLREWLRTNIHTVGMKYRANDLVKEVTGKKLECGPLVNHLRTKLGALYGI